MPNKHRIIPSIKELIETCLDYIPDLQCNPLDYCLQNCTFKEGLFLEFGVWRGATINKIAKCNPDKIIYGFDWFYGLPEEWVRKEGYFHKKSFGMAGIPPKDLEKNIRIVKGLFADTIPEFLKEHSGQIAFIHVDCDLYSSTKTIFDLMKDKITKGCILVFDEFLNFDTFKEGEFKAFMEFIEETSQLFEWIGMNGKLGMEKSTGEYEKAALIIGDRLETAN